MVTVSPLPTASVRLSLWDTWRNVPSSRTSLEQAMGDGTEASRRFHQCSFCWSLKFIAHPCDSLKTHYLLLRAINEQKSPHLQENIPPLLNERVFSKLSPPGQISLLSINSVSFSWASLPFPPLEGCRAVCYKCFRTRTDLNLYTYFGPNFLLYCSPELNGV